MAVGVWENAEPGVKRIIHKPGDSLMMMEVHFEAGASANEHSHPHEQMSYVLQGKFEFTLDGKVMVVSQGESLVIPSEVVHGAKAIEAGALLDTFTPLREDLLK